MTVDWIQSQLGITLEPWQAELLRKLHEVGPDGQYRYRQISVYTSRRYGLRMVGQCMEAMNAGPSEP